MGFSFSAKFLFKIYAFNNTVVVKCEMEKDNYLVITLRINNQYHYLYNNLRNAIDKGWL